MIGSVKVTVLIVMLMMLPSAVVSSGAEAQDAFFNVTVDTPGNGRIQLEPAVAADGKVPAGTVIRVSAVPDKGYVFDSGYYAMPGRWGKMFYESMVPVFDVVADQSGALEISQSLADHGHGCLRLNLALMLIGEAWIYYRRMAEGESCK